jgi:hypothetical protein
VRVFMKLLHAMIVEAEGGQRAAAGRTSAMPFALCCNVTAYAQARTVCRVIGGSFLWLWYTNGIPSPGLEAEQHQRSETDRSWAGHPRVAVAHNPFCRSL